MDIIRHNSHEEFYRSPFGAAKCSSNVKLRLDVHSKKNIKSVTLVLREDGNAPESFNMEVEYEREYTFTYSIDLKMPCNPYVVWYFFKVELEGERVYYGNNEKSLGGNGQKYENNPVPFQITVYSDGYKTPSWYSEAVVYQIFVDRFFNGDPKGEVLNPKPQSLIHSNWSDTPFYVKDSRGDVVKWDFYGGNIEGIVQKLDYLESLGIGCIYLNPVFESPSNHKYDVADYKKIDGMFGDEKDLENLCKAAQQRGIKIILDGVFSHTGSDSIYFNKYSRYEEEGAYQSKDSKYYKWYKFKNHPDDYKSWWGVKSLPEVNELEKTYMDFIIKDEDSVISHWMKAGVKGWRLDVADELPDEFIEALRKRVKGIDEDAVIIGEVWEDASNKMSYEKRRNYFSGLELDGVTNYPFRKIVSDYMLGITTSSQAGQRLLSIYENYPKPAFYSNLNLIGSHDVVRVLTLLGEAPDEKDMKDFQRYEYNLPEEKRDLGIKRLKLMSLVQMTFPGVPCIYYGDEAGMEGYSDPFNRAAFPWGKEEMEIVEWYKKIISIRNSSSAIKRGEWKIIHCNEDILSFARIDQSRSGRSSGEESEFILVAVNRSKSASARFEFTIGDIAWGKDFAMTDILSGESYFARDGILEFEMEKLSAVVLKK